MCDQDLLVAMHARLQISLCIGYNLWHPGYHPDRHTHRDRQHLTSL